MSNPAFDDMMTYAGNPDAAQGCRDIIARGNEALPKPPTNERE